MKLICKDCFTKYLRKINKGVPMPYGKGTYGRKRGRPSKKSKMNKKKKKK